MFIRLRSRLIADDDRNCRDASCGAGRLFGLPRKRIIGRKIDELAEPSFRPQLDHLWAAFLERGEQQGTLWLLASDGGVREVEYTAKRNALPGRHVLALRDISRKPSGSGEGPAWVQDYALFLTDAVGQVVAWYSGAERIYGYPTRRSSANLCPAFIRRTILLKPTCRTN